MICVLEVDPGMLHFVEFFKARKDMNEVKQRLSADAS